MKTLVTALTLAAAVLSAAPVYARNFHIAGGIQYVIQGMKEKEKKNFEDAQRIFGKAVTQLTAGIQEDPKDAEAWSYLAWAYAELDSSEQAGRAFDAAVTKLAGQPKQLERAEDNRKHYWAEYFNAGFAKYKAADELVKLNTLQGSQDPKAPEARAHLEEAAGEFRNAIGIDPKKMKAYENLAVIYALLDRSAEAMQTVEAGLKIDPDDDDLKKRKNELSGHVVEKAFEAGNTDEAIAKLEELLAQSPGNFNLLVRTGQAYFDKGKALGEAKKDEEAKAPYAKAGEYFGQAAAAAPDSLKRDMAFNQGLALLNAGDGNASAKVLFDQVQSHPQDVELHKLLRQAYDKAGHKEKAAEELWVILAFNKDAQAVPDAAAHASKAVKASAPGKTLESHGAPSEVKLFTSDQTKFEIWLYWDKKRAFVFSGGKQIGAANWAEFPTASAPTKTAGSKKG